MLDFLTTGVIIALAGNVLLLLVVLGLARELGVMLARSGPTFAKPTQQGPELGERLEPLVLSTVGGDECTIGASKRSMHLLLFTSPTCPACEALVPAVKAFATSYGDAIRVIVLVSIYDATKCDQWIQRLAGSGAKIAVAPEVHRRMGISLTPYAVLLGRDNEVRTRGIVNTLEQLESLIAMEVFTDQRLPVGDSGMSAYEPISN